MSNNNKTPAIRFKGFTDTWEQRKLGDIGETYTGLSGKTKEDFGHGNAKFVTYMNVFSNSIADSSMTESVEIDKKQNEVKYGDVFFTTSSETPDEVGMSSVWLENGENTYLNSFCFGYRPSVKINPYYMAYMLRSDNVRKNIVFLAQGISRYNISKNKMMEISVPLPALEEQQRIGEYFRNLDTLITLHQRKYDKLTKVKKAMLEKMFPQNGADKPEIRFKGFTDAWEQRKLGEISESFEYGLNAAATEYDGKHKYIRITDIDDSTHLFLQDDLTSPDIDFSTADDYLLQEGDVLFARTGASVGKTYIYRRSDGDLYFAGFLIRAKIKSDYDADFVFQNTLTDSYDSYIRITSQRSGQPGVNAQEYANFALSVPSLAEQKKIGAYFSHLDTLITLHQRKCDKYKIIKAGLIRKLFP